MRLFVIAAVAVAALLPSAAQAQSADPAQIVVDASMRRGGSFEKVSASPAGTFCAGRPVLVRNATSRPLRLDLYEAQTDVGFPVAPIAPGGTGSLDVVQPARVVAIDPATGRAIFYFVSRRCI